MLRNLFLMKTRIICLIRQGLNLWGRNIKWDLLTVVSMNFINELMFKDWNWWTFITDMLNLEENKLIYKKSYLRRKKFSEIPKHEVRTNWERWRELMNYELTDDTKAHFTNAGNARADEFYEWFRWISRSGIESQWEIVLRSQSTSSDSRFLFHAEPRQTLANLYIEYVWTTGERFW